MLQSNALALRFVGSMNVIDLNREIIFLTGSDVQRMAIKHKGTDLQICAWFGARPLPHHNKDHESDKREKPSKVSSSLFDTTC